MTTDYIVFRVTYKKRGHLWTKRVVPYVRVLAMTEDRRAALDFAIDKFYSFDQSIVVRDYLDEVIFIASGCDVEKLSALAERQDPIYL